MASVYNIEKLNGINYANWSSDVKYLLMERGLWDIVTEVRKVPVRKVVYETNAEGKSSEKEDPAYTNELIKFNNLSNQALSLLYLNITSEYRKLIENINNPVEAWKAIKSNFRPDSRSAHMAAFTELIDTRINHGESINLFGARILRVVGKLKDVDPNFDLIYANFQLLRYLPQQFDNVVQQILRWNSDKFVFSEILAELISEESRLKVREKDRRGKIELQNVTMKSTTGNLMCTHCNKTGHSTQNCRYLNSYDFSLRSRPRFRNQNSNGTSSSPWQNERSKDGESQNGQPNFYQKDRSRYRSVSRESPGHQRNGLYQRGRSHQRRRSYQRNGSYHQGGSFHRGSFQQRTGQSDRRNSPHAKYLLTELEILNVRISDMDEIVTADIALMCSLLKKHGEELESGHKDALDRFFSTLRNICREDRLDAVSRLKLLEVIEMRAMKWRTNENVTNYFTTKFCQLEDASERQTMSGSISPNTILNTQNQVGSVALAPGEILRSSGKFSKPTKIAGKNYYKDEIVIRNCDSGKVNVGARDRLVQITGPHEEAISHAKYLVEDTIKRNVSPVRDNLNMSELSIENKEAVDYGSSYFDRNHQVSSKRQLTHSYSMSDASTREMSVPVYVGDEIIMLSGTKADLLKTAKTVLTEYFTFHLDPLEKEVNSSFQSKTSLLNNNQRFALKKQTSLKDNLHGSFRSVDQSFSRQSSSSMSSSSDDILPDEESSELEALVPAPIPPPSYPDKKIAFSRKFLLECARHPICQKAPPDYEHIVANFPEIIPQYPMVFDPSLYLHKPATS